MRRRADEGLDMTNAATGIALYRHAIPAAYGLTDVTYLRDNNMRVTDIESIVLQYDMDEELGFSQGYFSKRTAHLVKVHTDEGIIGIGEIFGAGNFAFANQAIVNHVIRPLIVGRNPLDINVIWHEVYNAVRDHGQKGLPICCLSGIDIALWDIFGKVSSLPLYQLLGGKAREQFVAYGYGMMFRKCDDLPAVYEDEVARIVEMGFTASKMKIGMDFSAFKIVRFNAELFPVNALRLLVACVFIDDYGCGWTGHCDRLHLTRSLHRRTANARCFDDARNHDAQEHLARRNAERGWLRCCLPPKPGLYSWTLQRRRDDRRVERVRCGHRGW